MRKHAPLRFRNEDRRSLYLVRNPENGRVKIGLSDLVESRLHSLELAVGVRLERLVVIPECAGYEEHLHEAFAHARVYGEWFTFTPTMRALVADLVQRPDQVWGTLLEFIAVAEDRRRAGVAPEPAPPAVVETPEARLRNALQILALKESAADEFVEGFKRSYGKNRQIYNHEIAARALWAFAWQCLGLDEIERLIQLAAQDLKPVHIRFAKDETTKYSAEQLAVAVGPAVMDMVDQLRQMEQTKRELADHNADFQAAESVIDSLESQRG